nr:MAG TPA: hypothetical protein [Caudoviricetes sp.]
MGKEKIEMLLHYLRVLLFVAIIIWLIGIR